MGTTSSEALHRHSWLDQSYFRHTNKACSMEDEIDPDYTDFQKKRTEFYSWLVGGMLGCLGIHLTAPLFAGDPGIRLGLVVAFFGLLASSVYSFDRPYRNYLTARARWKFSEATRDIQETARRSAASKARFVRLPSHIAGLGVLFVALAVLASWPQFAAISGLQAALVALAAFAFVIAFPLSLFVKSGEFRAFLHLDNQLEDLSERFEGRIKSSETEAEERLRRMSDPVEIVGPGQFLAGGQRWKWDDFYTNAAVFGASGSGKSLCVLNALLDGLLTSSTTMPAPPSALLIDTTGDYRDRIRSIVRRCGRERDLIIVDPRMPQKTARWNPFGGDESAETLAERLANVYLTVERTSNDDQYFINDCVEYVKHAIHLHRGFRPDWAATIWEMYQLSLDDTKEYIEEWKRGNGVQNISEEFDAAVNFFTERWPEIEDRKRDTLRSFLTQMGSGLMAPRFKEIFADQSDFRVPEAIDAGKIIYFGMPTGDDRVSAKFSATMNTFMKLAFFEAILQEERIGKERRSLFFCDEFQTIFTVGHRAGDAKYFSRTRKSNHANIVGFQNLSSLYRSDLGKHDATDLVGNCAIKFFCRNIDLDTNEFASQLFGTHLEVVSESSVAFGDASLKIGFDRGITTSTREARRIKPEEFQTLVSPRLADGVDFAEVVQHVASRSHVSLLPIRHKWRRHPIGEG
jgi:hypothetical protein